jgi:hypothetical protein
MEVHHHPNMEKKKFKEYFLKFIMIFLAVTMGFIAENIREHFSNNETEKRNMEIIVDNLKDDTAQLQFIIFHNENRVRALDTLLSFQDTDNPDTLRSDFFNAVVLRRFSTGYFFSNKAAIEKDCACNLSGLPVMGAL